MDVSVQVTMMENVGVLQKSIKMVFTSMAASSSGTVQMIVRMGEKNLGFGFYVLRFSFLLLAIQN